CTHNPLGVKGCGEAGAIGSPAAVINAICDAIGVAPDRDAAEGASGATGEEQRSAGRRVLTGQASKLVVEPLVLEAHAERVRVLAKERANGVEFVRAVAHENLRAARVHGT
ncbi:MAG: hypothetical protein HUU26_10810, partial [Gemmatimonadaceae bacterium]|nr:hypothetical protein [Gemmatimonadaceae bacterium]